MPFTARAAAAALSFLAVIPGCALLDQLYGNNPVAPERTFSPPTTRTPSDVKLSPEGDTLYLAGYDAIAFSLEGEPKRDVEYGAERLYPVAGYVYGMLSVAGAAPPFLYDEEGNELGVVLNDGLETLPYQHLSSSWDGSAAVVGGLLEQGTVDCPNECHGVIALNVGIASPDGSGEVLYTGSAPLGGIALSPDGSQLLVYDTGAASLLLVDVATKSATPVGTLGSQPLNFISWPPGGHPFVAVAGGVNADLTIALYELDVTSGEETLIVDGNALTFTPPSDERLLVRTLDGAHLIAANASELKVLTRQSGEEKWVARVATTIISMALSSDGASLYVLYGSEIAVFDVEKLLAAEPLDPNVDLGEPE